MQILMQEMIKGAHQLYYDLTAMFCHFYVILYRVFNRLIAKYVRDSRELVLDVT